MLRTLDLQANNTEKTLNWASRKPLSYASYASNRWIPASCSPSGINCTDSISPSNYVLPWPGYVLANNAIVHVYFQTTCTTAATLNVGGTGAKNILDKSCQPLVAGNNTTIVGGGSVSYATLIYKASLNAWIKCGGDNSGSSGYRTFIPPELIIDLCTAVGAHPYVLTPAYDDTADWTSGFAAYFLANAPQWMRLIQETTNETFNAAPGFDNNGYAVAYELAVNGGWSLSAGAPSGTTYTITAIATGSTTTLTLNVPFTGQVGAWMTLGGTFSGVSGISGGQYVHVTAINVGGNQNKIIIDPASSGTYTSGGTIVAANAERWEWVGTQAAKFSKVLHDTFSGDTRRYDALVGFSIAASDPLPPTSAVAALNSPQFVLQGGWPAYTYVTAVNTSNYIQSSQYNTSAETTAVATWAPRQGTGSITGTMLTMTAGTNPNVGDEISGSGIVVGTTVVSGSGPFVVTPSQNYASGPVYAGVPATRRSTESTYLNACLTGTGSENLPHAVLCWTNMAGWANGFGIKKMYAYEGGPDQNTIGMLGTGVVEQFRYATLENSAWQTLIATIYNSWKFGQYPPVSSQYPLGFTAVFPSQFFLASSKPRAPADGGWNMMADIWETPTPLYQGIKSYNQ